MKHGLFTVSGHAYMKIEKIYIQLAFFNGKTVVTIIQIQMSIIIFVEQLPTRSIYTIGRADVLIVKIINFVTKAGYCVVEFVTIST